MALLSPNIAVSFEVEFDPRGLLAFQRAMATLGTTKVRVIMQQSLNQAGAKALTKVKRELTKQTGLKYGAVGDALQVSKANPVKLEYEIKAIGSHFGLSAFRAVQRKGGVAAAPWGQRRTFPHTFMLHGEVFKRSGADRLPIKKLWGPSVPVEMERAMFNEAFETAQMGELQTVTERKLQQYMP